MVINSMDFFCISFSLRAKWSAKCDLPQNIKYKTRDGRLEIKDFAGFRKRLELFD